MPIYGKDGTFRVGATVVGNIDSWSLDLSAGSVEVTSMSTEAITFRNFGQTIREWSGTASGTLDLADAQQLALAQSASTAAAATAAMRLYTLPASYWAGNAYMSKVTINSQVSNKVSVSFNFQGTSGITYTSS
jgi:hypothetical protein